MDRNSDRSSVSDRTIEQAVEKVRSIFDPLGGLPGDLSKLGLPKAGPTLAKVSPSSDPAPQPDHLPLEEPESLKVQKPKLPHISPCFPDPLKVLLAHLSQAVLDEDHDKQQTYLHRSLQFLVSLFASKLQVSPAKEILASALDQAPDEIRKVFYSDSKPLPHCLWLNGHVPADLNVLHSWLDQTERLLQAEHTHLSSFPAPNRESKQSVVIPEVKGLLNRADTSLEDGDIETALHHLNRAIRLLVEHSYSGLEMVKAFILRAKAYSKQGQIYRALLDAGRAVESAIRGGCGEKEALRERLYLLKGQMMDSEVLEDLKNLLLQAESDDERSEILGLRARQLESRGRWEAAVHHYEKASELCSDRLLRIRYLKLALNRLRVGRQPPLWIKVLNEIEQAWNEGEDFSHLLPLDKVKACIEETSDQELLRHLASHLKAREKRYGSLDEDARQLLESVTRKLVD